MRELKFRAYDKAQTGAYHGIQYQGGDSLFDFIGALCQDAIEYGCDWEFMQFTGKCDKTGKEIYEGDIIRIEGVSSDDDVINPIEYSDLSAMFVRRVDKKVSIGLCVTDRRDLEVIGNIFENQDLLPK